MSDDAVPLGKLRRLSDDGFEGRLERLIEHDRNAVWRMLTESEKIAQWLAPGSIELRVGGAVRWELNAVGEKTRLHLSVRLPKGEDAARACAGFEGHLDMLAAALEGVPIRFPVPHFLEARRAYQKLLEG